MQNSQIVQIGLLNISLSDEFRQDEKIGLPSFDKQHQTT